LKKNLETKEENFEIWDDYIEWKAFRKPIENIESKLNAISNGTFSVAY